MKPDFFFKYLHPSLAVVLESRSLRFTQPDYLNDPSEFLPFVDQFISPERLEKEARLAIASVDMDELFETEFDRAWRTLTRHERRSIDKSKAKSEFRRTFDPQKGHLVAQGSEFLASAISDMDQALRDRFSESMRSNLGVLCLSSTGCNELLWAHYADGHRGFALQFTSDNMFFQPDATDSETLTGAQPVIYANDRPTLTEIIDENNRLELFFFRKSLSWAYEEEWRIVRSIARADESMNKNGEAIALFRFPPKALNAVILGYRASVTLVQTVTNALAANHEYRHVKLLRADFAKDSYQIVHKPV